VVAQMAATGVGPSTTELVRKCVNVGRSVGMSGQCLQHLEIHVSAETLVLIQQTIRIAAPGNTYIS
jgi:hypothetical protein